MSMFISAIQTILPSSSPLLLATMGALISEHAGVLAVFLDGAINLAGFVSIAVLGFTGNVFFSVGASIFITVLLLFLVSLFNEKTKANPFLTALAVNLLSSGCTSFFASWLFGTRGTINLEEIAARLSVTYNNALYLPRNLFFPFTLLCVFCVAFFLRRTQTGIELRAVGTNPELLFARGKSPYFYRSLSWSLAALFASLSGSMLSIDLGAWVPNVSAGRGWTALAAVYLGFKKPWLCVLAVLCFASAEYFTNILQGFGKVPSTLILGLPYALSLFIFIFIPQNKQ